MTNQTKQSNQIAQIKGEKLFYCYSPKLRKYLDQNGTHWIGKGLNEENGKTYWTFKQTARLGVLLSEYKKGMQFAR